MARNDSPALLWRWNKVRAGRKVAAEAVEARAASTDEPLPTQQRARPNRLGFRKPHSIAVRNRLILFGQATRFYGFRKQMNLLKKWVGQTRKANPRESNSVQFFSCPFAPKL